VQPSNIIMGAAPRLIDLSIAVGLGDVPDLRKPLGSAPYMAPEQCDPERLGDIAPLV
jgi:hypothetical protein